MHILLVQEGELVDDGIAFKDKVAKSAYKSYLESMMKNLDTMIKTAITPLDYPKQSLPKCQVVAVPLKTLPRSQYLDAPVRGSMAQTGLYTWSQ